jgi:hypothetical protein
LVQSAYAWWRNVLEAFKSMDYERSKVDPCLFYKWTTRHGLQVWMTWIDDCFSCGIKEAVTEAKKQLHDYFKGKCDDGGELQEYVGCKIEYNREEHWNTSDLFTKNPNEPDFEWQTAYYVGVDEYMKHKERMKQEKREVTQGENVGNCD